jgi:hypothetical protein
MERRHGAQRCTLHLTYNAQSACRQDGRLALHKARRSQALLSQGGRDFCFRHQLGRLTAAENKIAIMFAHVSDSGYENLNACLTTLACAGLPRHFDRSACRGTGQHSAVPFLLNAGTNMLVMQPSMLCISSRPGQRRFVVATCLRQCAERYYRSARVVHARLLDLAPAHSSCMRLLGNVVIARRWHHEQAAPRASRE